MLFGGRENKHTTMIFFIPSSNLGAVPKDSTPVKFSYSFAVFSKLEKTQKFEKTRIRLNSDVFATLAINILKHPTFTNVTLSFWFYPVRVAHISEWKMITQGQRLFAKSGDGEQAGAQDLIKRDYTATLLGFMVHIFGPLIIRMVDKQKDGNATIILLA